MEERGAVTKLPPRCPRGGRWLSFLASVPTEGLKPEPSSLRLAPQMTHREEACSNPNAISQGLPSMVRTP